MRGFSLEDESDLRRLLGQLFRAGGSASGVVPEALSPSQLSDRIEAVLRLSDAHATAETTSLHFGDLTIDPVTREVEAGSGPVELTAKEFDLLMFIASSPRQVFSRQQLLEHVWSSCREWQDESTVTELIRRVRQKIEVDPSHPLRISTVRGVGYKFVPPAETLDLGAIVANPASPRLVPRHAAGPRHVPAYRELPVRRHAASRRSQGFC